MRRLTQTMITLRLMSDNFIVSARKYRPQTFDEMLGQEAICLTLKSAIKQGKIAHAYLFCGPRGVGKTCLLYTSPSPRDS